MFNFAYQLELLLTAAKPPLYLSEMTVNRQGPRYICLEGKPGGWLFRFLLSLIGLAPAPRKVEVYNDRIEYSVIAKWFQSKEKITFSTICSTGHQFFRFPHFLFLAWLCFIYGVFLLIPLFQSDSDDVSAMLIIICIGCFVVGFIMLWLYFKVQRYIIYAYTNCGKGMLFAFQPRKSFILPPPGSIDITLEDVNSFMNLLGDLIEANKSSRETAFLSSAPYPAQSIVSPAQSISQGMNANASPEQTAGAQNTEQNVAHQTAARSSFIPGQMPNFATIQPPPPVVDEQKSNEFLNKCLNQYGFSDINELVKCKTPLSESLNFQKALNFAPPTRKQKLMDIQKEQKILLDKAKTRSAIYIAIAVLAVLGLIGIIIASIMSD